MLPVEVLEILSTGPGAVYKHYRIEITANNGEPLGFVDIRDEDDLKLAVGKDNYQQLLFPRSGDRDMQEVFKFVVENRIILNLLSTERKTRIDGRRVGAATTAVGNGSLVSLIRDSPDAFVFEEPDSDSEAGSRIKKENGKHWLRLFSSRHKVSGQLFSTLILFESKNVFIQSRTNYFFSSAPIEQRFKEMDLVIKSFDLRRKVMNVLRIKGEYVFEWLPKGVKVDFMHIVRREKFGKYIWDNIRLKYSPTGHYSLELFLLPKEKCEYE